jgi:hypothetical protein
MTTTELPPLPRKRAPVTQEDRDINNYLELRTMVDWINAHTIHKAHQAAPSSYFPGYSGNERVSGGSIPDPTARVALEDRRFKLDPVVERQGQCLLGARLLLEEYVELAGGEPGWRACSECHTNGPIAAHDLCKRCYERQWRRERKNARTHANPSDQPADAA